MRLSSSITTVSRPDKITVLHECGQLPLSYAVFQQSVLPGYHPICFFFNPFQIFPVGFEQTTANML